MSRSRTYAIAVIHPYTTCGVLILEIGDIALATMHISSMTISTIPMAFNKNYFTYFSLYFLTMDPEYTFVYVLWHA